MQCHPSTQYIIMLGSEQKLLSYKSNLEDAELNTLSSIAVELNIKLDWTCELQSWMIGTKRLAALMSISLCHHCICSKAIKVNYCERTSDEIYTRNDWKLALDVHTQRLFIGIKIKKLSVFCKKTHNPVNPFGAQYQIFVEQLIIYRPRLNLARVGHRVRKWATDWGLQSQLQW